MPTPRWLRLAWLALTALLFAVWIGWLAFLVVRRPVVLAHAPFLVADLNVVASVRELNDRDPVVTVKEVVWARDPQQAKGLAGKDVRVTNLSRCRQDWRGPGDYVMPLLRTGEDAFEVADATGLTEEAKKKDIEDHDLLPSLSPGYDPVGEDGKTVRPPHIYPATPETRAQLRQIH